MEQAKTYRVCGQAGRGTERVVREGMSREEAIVLKERMQADPLCRGFSIWIEEEPTAEEEARLRELRIWHGQVRP